jgi:hypothetical protein
MDKLYPIIRRKRRPLFVPDAPLPVNPQALKPDRLPPVAVVPLVVAESAPDVPPVNRAKTRHAQRNVTSETA